MKKSLLTALYFSILLFTQQVVAQDIIKVERKGLLFGTSLGPGYTSLKFPNKNQTDTGLALDLKLGYMVRPNLALLLSTNVSVYDYSGFGRNRKRDFGIVAPSVQYWVTNKLWFLGGVGLGGDNPVFWDIRNPDNDPLETKYYFGLGGVAAVGYEIYQKNNFAIDIKTKISYRNVELKEGKTNGVSAALLIGVNFY
ncbi:hypothetical protein [Adhaeribacter aquaticus]|uniref:hypothetical protein n=1 Tax=Adhaeribacter aquaticus TaxID=299567 RepID=UPI000559577A|nr:hypothetical protein [Adhaeribacter aquaticus]